MNILVTGALPEALGVIPEIEKLGHTVQFMQFEKDALPCPYEWVEGVICNGLFLSHDIERFINLRYIQLTSAGYDRVPMDYVQAHGIDIHNARGVYSIPMAEFAISGVLQLYKQAAFFHENQMKRRWEKHRGLLELYGKTVYIVGCGSVGTECAKRFRAFGCKVIGVDLVPHVDAQYDTMFSIERIDEVLGIADIMVLTLPLTETTYGMMDAERLAKLKPGCVLVNIARGAIVDEAALIEALQAGILGGAVLDVFEQEPLDARSLLWQNEKVVLTPHNSFVSEMNGNRLAKVMIDNLRGVKDE